MSDSVVGEVHRSRGTADVGPARIVILVLLALASWEVARAIAVQLLIALNVGVTFGIDGFSIRAILLQTLQVLIAFAIAAPIALLMLRPVLRIRA
jgi:hypothetical protein